MKTKYIGLLILFIILFSSNNTQAAVPWTTGSQYKFTLNLNNNEEYTDGKDKGITNKFNQKISFESTVTIKSINRTDETLNITEYNNNGINENTVFYNATEIVSNWLSFSPYHNYDDDGNVILTGLNVYWPSDLFIDPDYELINDILKDQLNESMVLASFFDWNTFKFYKITLGDILGNATSYTIFGQSSISAARDNMDSKAQKWEINLNFDNKFTYVYYKNSHKNYVKYDKYSIDMVWEYDNDGVLKSSTVTKSYQYTIDGITVTGNSKREIKQGSGLIGNINIGSIPGFELYLALPSLFVMVYIIRKKYN